jgi:hypothetical protein
MKLIIKPIGNVHTILVIFSLLLLAQMALAETWFTNEVWISPVAQTNGGNGTLDFPYDGSTQPNFDTLMGNLPRNITIHLLAGTYQTLGSPLGWNVKSGQKILGSGIDVTILNLVSGPTNDGAYTLEGEMFAQFPATNIEICDLTANANYNPSLGTYSCYGVVLTGSGHAIRRVKVINTASYTNLPTQSAESSEAWGVVINGCWPFVGVYSTGNVIEECEVSQFAGGGHITAIAFDGGPTNPISGIMRNNRVFLPPGINTSCYAFNNNWTLDLLLEGNYVSGGDVGCYGDTGGTTNMIVTYNMFNNCRNLAYFQGIARINLTFAFNKFRSTNTFSLNPAAFFFNNTFGGSYTNIVIIGNTIDFYGAAGGPTYFVKALNVQGLVVVNNIVDASLTNMFSGCTNVSVYNNYDLTGNFLTNLNQVASPNGVTRGSVMSPTNIAYQSAGTNTYYAKYGDEYIGVKGFPFAGGQVFLQEADIVLPSAAGHAGKDFIVADESGNLRQSMFIKQYINIKSTSPDKINGGTSIINTNPYTAMTIISDGTNWFAY